MEAVEVVEPVAADVSSLAAVARLDVGFDVDVDVEVVPSALLRTANWDCRLDSVTSIWTNSFVMSVCCWARLA